MIRILSDANLGFFGEPDQAPVIEPSGGWSHTEPTAPRPLDPNATPSPQPVQRTVPRSVPDSPPPRIMPRLPEKLFPVPDATAGSGPTPAPTPTPDPTPTPVPQTTSTTVPASGATDVGQAADSSLITSLLGLVSNMYAGAGVSGGGSGFDGAVSAPIGGVADAGASDAQAAPHKSPVVVVLLVAGVAGGIWYWHKHHGRQA